MVSKFREKTPTYGLRNSVLGILMTNFFYWYIKRINGLSVRKDRKSVKEEVISNIFSVLEVAGSDGSVRTSEQWLVLFLFFS